MLEEKPIKLFDKRSQRYPEPESADIPEAVVRAGLAAIPIVGGSINEMLSLILAPSVERRRGEWLKDLANVVEELEKQVVGFDPKNLSENEAFISATIRATRVALSTHQKDKREMLRNALLNIAIGKAPREELQQVFLNVIDAFTCSHVKVLNFLWKQHQIIAGSSRSFREPLSNYGHAISVAFSELAKQPYLVQQIMSDLNLRGFSEVSGPRDAYPRNPAITNLGIEFLHFIEEPQK